jgi:hypothetical protein
MGGEGDDKDVGVGFELRIVDREAASLAVRPDEPESMLEIVA